MVEIKDQRLIICLLSSLQLYALFKQGSQDPPFNPDQKPSAFNFKVCSRYLISQTQSSRHMCDNSNSPPAPAHRPATLLALRPCSDPVFLFFILRNQVPLLESIKTLASSQFRDSRLTSCSTVGLRIGEIQVQRMAKGRG